ncbi:hypothetical protein EZV62_004961 [Acer yangbiense]|uniref:Protein kinase domain-containing protein n=1 Tax=Acer yangbiense TaxID=1000413 RepID=A0A5C7INJ0_9ROSI|nr:hypothetical protein EZV62_004961 [Acer yangbiense]
MVSPFLSLVFLISNYIALVGCLNDEGLALLSFKQVTQDNLNNWKSSDENPCAWDGVTCRDLKVNALSIPNKKLSGFLHPAIGKLSEIRRLNLKNNNFSGNLPIELFGALNLQSLVLSGNAFSGPVPTQIGNLKYLQVLDLSGNSFRGSIPSSIVQCKRLKKLLLNQNSFNSSLPDSFGTNLITLQKINLSFNNLTGLNPENFGSLPNLKDVLDLSHNLFNGPIPASLGKIAERVYIDLSHNNFSGPIPQNAGMLSLGPTAFIENPSLCGPPLKISCPSGTLDPYTKPFPYDPSPNSVKSRKVHQLGSVIAVVVIAMVMGICIVGLLLHYRHKKACACNWGENVGGFRFEEKLMIRKEIFCFTRKDVETLSENSEQYDFVPLDLQVEFDLEQLLKASAFLLGKSRIGIVYKVVLNNGPAMAVRRLGQGGSQRFKEFQTEVEAIAKIRHPNIVSLRAYFWSIDEKLLIYDYIPNGDLATAIHGKSGMIYFRPPSWQIRLRIIKGIAKGLAFLHEFSPRRYVHGDLRPSNILLGERMEAHISDFGLGRLADIAEESETVQWEQMTNGTPQQSSPYEFTPINTTMTRSCYQAPEASKIRKPTQKWDVYSYGVILLEIISGKFPVIQIGSLEMDLVQWIQLILEDKKAVTDVFDPFLANDADREDEIVAVLGIALVCTHKSPDKRPSMKYVCDSLDRITSSTKQQFMLGEEENLAK